MKYFPANPSSSAIKLLIISNTIPKALFIVDC